jgi:hypothetical protein
VYSLDCCFDFPNTRLNPISMRNEERNQIQMKEAFSALSFTIGKMTIYYIFWLLS